MTTPAAKPALEIWLERGLFASRWLMAPFYVGLAVGLAALLAVFIQEVAHEAPALFREGGASHAIVFALSLIDLSLNANLILIVIFAGYENFVSRMDVGEHHDRPDWMGALDFTDMKMKLTASIVAISAVALLRAFMALADEGLAPDAARLGWLVGLHLTFVVSGVMMAVMDRLSQKPGR
ncbi:MAG: TIGR00645 family protein [Caulobacteraceae bacterium]|nr:TIGR00645 family protein [Caulobacteraceae bacterium]